MKGLELDGFCEEIGVAFEYNGRQHYENVPFFHNNRPENLIAQQRRDSMKEELCFKHWIVLITIRYDDPCLEKTLETELEALGVLASLD